MKAKLLGYGLVIAVFAAINLVLVGGQKLWHHGDQVKLDTLKSQLETQKADITARESELSALTTSADHSETVINNLRSQIESVESHYPSGIPEAVYPSYTQAVGDFNSLVQAHNGTLARYHALYEDYSHRVGAYNALVKQANSTSDQIGGTWYIVPVPGPRIAREHSTTVSPRR